MEIKESGYRLKIVPVHIYLGGEIMWRVVEECIVPGHLSYKVRYELGTVRTMTGNRWRFADVKQHYDELAAEVQALREQEEVKWEPEGVFSV